MPYTQYKARINYKTLHNKKIAKKNDEKKVFINHVRI